MQVSFWLVVLLVCSIWESSYRDFWSLFHFLPLYLFVCVLQLLTGQWCSLQVQKCKVNFKHKLAREKDNDNLPMIAQWSKKYQLVNMAAWLSGQGAGFVWRHPGFRSHSDHCLDLSWVILESYPPHFVNSQLVCLLSVGVPIPLWPLSGFVLGDPWFKSTRLCK